ncbi:hypothetical protein PIB30_026244 [Stylosanthes scabra]|uniref:Uncharacterized protein n=1 Tax=Stylosanthes scabra TaxID=79078 RepID=A0ABU6RAL6_9FABA|nr:hypothetical protein [Stylosanthes scabra]
MASVDLKNSKKEGEYSTESRMIKMKMATVESEISEKEEEDPQHRKMMEEMKQLYVDVLRHFHGPKLVPPRPRRQGRRGRSKNSRKENASN